MKDLFEHPEDWKGKLKKVLMKYENEDFNYQVCSNLEEDLKNIGYSIDWGLDAIPYNLKKLKPDQKNEP